MRPGCASTNAGGRGPMNGEWVVAAPGRSPGMARQPTSGTSRQNHQRPIAGQWMRAVVGINGLGLQNGIDRPTRN